MSVIMIGNWRPAGLISDSGLTPRRRTLHRTMQSLSVLDSTAETSGDIHLGSKGRVQESTTNYCEGTFVSKTCDLKKKKKEIWPLHKNPSSF